MRFYFRFKSVLQFIALSQSLIGEAIAEYVATEGGVGCLYGDQVGSVSGFAETYYSYPLTGAAAGNTADGSVSTEFFETGYSQYGLIGSITGIVSPTLSYYDEENTYATSEIGTFTIYLWHFALEMSGYFYAETSGVYTIELTNVDDFAAVWFGKGLDCCDPSATNNDVKPDFATGRSFDAQEDGASSYSVYLSAGSFYPIKLRYANVNSRALLSFTVVDPAGNSITDFSDYIYQFVNIDGSCSSSSATLPFNTNTVTTDVEAETTTTVPTTYTSGDSTITSTVVLVDEPPLSNTTTTTDVETETTTTVPTTYTSGDSTITSTVVLVEEPTLPVITTTTDVESETTTTVATTYTSNEKVIVGRVVFIERPRIPVITTTTDVESVTTTTLGTTYTSGGRTITGSVILVEEPPLSTTTITMDVEAGTTTTVPTTYTSKDNTITSTVVLVEEPTLPVITTTTDVESETTTTVATTYTSRGKKIIGSIIVVERPSISTITVTTDVPCKSVTTKITTFTSDNKVLTKNVIIVEEPYSSQSSGGTTSAKYSDSKTFAFYSNDSSSMVNENSKGTTDFATIPNPTALTITGEVVTDEFNTGSTTDITDISKTAGAAIEAGKTSKIETSASSEQPNESAVIPQTAEEITSESTFSSSEWETSSSEYTNASSDVAIYEGSGASLEYAFPVAISVLISLLL